MTTFNEERHSAEFLRSEARGTRSRDSGILNAGENLDAGAVLSRLTATGNYVEHDPGGAGGAETADAILYSPVDATLADAPCVVISRDAEVDSNALVWITGIIAGDQADAIVALEAKGIIVR